VYNASALNQTDNSSARPITCSGWCNRSVAFHRFSAGCCWQALAAA